VIVTVARSYGRHYPYLHLDVQEDMRRLSDFASPADRELSELGERFDRAMDAIVRERTRRGDLRVDVDPTMARFVIVGAVNWTQRWFVPRGGGWTAARSARSCAPGFCTGCSLGRGAERPRTRRLSALRLRHPRAGLQRGRRQPGEPPAPRARRRRVSRVNLRREFFRAAPAEVLAALERTEAREHLLEYTEFPEAEEWRTSVKLSERHEVTPLEMVSTA
jgi:hypothetical protein